jgi:hypothetical protein
MATILERQAPTCDTGGAYAAKDLIGGKLTFSVALRQSGVLDSLVVTDLAVQKSALDVVFFDADPSATTFTDQAALDIADADLVKVQAVVSVAASDYVDFNDNSAAFLNSLGVPLRANSLGQVFVAVVSRGTPTYVSTADLSIGIGVRRD